jgi:ribosomal protein L37AE/L43A
MECQFCHRETTTRIKKSVYSEGIWVCPDCRELIDKRLYQPYSQVIDKVAVLETGYYVNRKLARIRRRQ